MSNVILTDEEIEAQLRSRLTGHILTDTEKADINMDADQTMGERENNRRDQQANYDKHKGAR